MKQSVLKDSILLKEKEYKEAIRAKKLFWEVRMILDQKRHMEKHFLKGKSETTG